MTRLQGLAALEAVLVEQSRVALELRNPQYAESFRDALSGGLDAAMKAARPHLGRQPWWYELLTSLLSVELSMDRVRLALSLMNSHRADGRDDGRLLSYHLDNLVIHSTALLEKSDHLMCRVYRVLVKRVDPVRFSDKLQHARADLRALAVQYRTVRNPLVHVVGGPVRALEEDRLWEAHILTGAKIAEVIEGHYDVLPSARGRWYQGFVRQSQSVIATIDTAFAQAVRDIRNEPDRGRRRAVTRRA